MLKAVRLPRSTTLLPEARLERIEIRVVIVTPVDMLIARDVTSMRSAYSGVHILCPSKSSDAENRTTMLEKFHQTPSERLEYLILGVQLKKVGGY